MIDQTFRIKALKDKVALQNLEVKSKLRFSYSDKYCLIVRLRIRLFRLLIVMRLTADRNNLIRLCVWGIPSTWPSLLDFTRRFCGFPHGVCFAYCIFQNIFTLNTNSIKTHRRSVVKILFTLLNKY